MSGLASAARPHADQGGAEVVQLTRDVDVLRAVGFHEDVARPPEERDGRLDVAEVLEDHRQVVEVDGDLLRLRAVEGPVDGERPLEQRSRRLHVPQVLDHHGQVVEVDRDVDVLGTLKRLVDGQGALHERPRGARIPEVLQHHRDVVQVDGDGRLVGSRLVDLQRALEERQGVRGAALHQHQVGGGPAQQPGRRARGSVRRLVSGHGQDV